MFWYTHAFSSALNQAFVPLAEDPLLIWLYVSITLLTLVGWIGFAWSFISLDKEDDELNALPEGKLEADSESVKV